VQDRLGGGGAGPDRGGVLDHLVVLLGDWLSHSVLIKRRIVTQSLRFHGVQRKPGGSMALGAGGNPMQSLSPESNPMRCFRPTLHDSRMLPAVSARDLHREAAHRLGQGLNRIQTDSGFAVAGQ
jgi:hypothetical protein